MIGRSRSTKASFVGLVLLASWIAVGPAIGSETIRNIPQMPHGVPAGTSLEVISRTIVRASAERQWYAESESPGLIVVTTKIRTHTATVEIGFDEKDFWINYRESTHLGYRTKDSVQRSRYPKRIGVPRQEGPRIHRNYDIWVQQLADQISTRAGLLVSLGSREQDRSSESAPVSIADELDKLDALRVQGVLTQDEFDSQKAKLLARWRAVALGSARQIANSPGLGALRARGNAAPGVMGSRATGIAIF